MGDKSNIIKLEKIIHPLVRKMRNLLRKKKKKFSFCEIPLLMK